MLSYENLILGRQDSARDDCKNCVMNEVQEMYNSNLPKMKGVII